MAEVAQPVHPLFVILHAWHCVLLLPSLLLALNARRLLIWFLTILSLEVAQPNLEIRPTPATTAQFLVDVGRYNHFVIH